jgi:pyrroloquinoline quinone biosynthesis protein B
VKVHVLGSAAGGGFPQWNCNCRNCKGWREGTVRAQARTQSSIAVSADAERWLLFNASPDILQQLREWPAAQPARALRDTAMGAILLMDAQVDHTTGLYMLREHRQPWDIWCTEPVARDLREANPIFTVLGHYSGLAWHDMPLGEPGFSVPSVPGLQLQALPLRSNAPPYSPRRDRPEPADNVGMLVRDPRTGGTLFYAPGLGQMEDHVWAAMQQASCVLVDGTLWTDDEMITLGASTRSSRAMGHLPQSGPDGMISWLQRLPATTRKVLIHINNTNPILDEDSPQRAELDRLGIEVATDGMEITL